MLLTVAAGTPWDDLVAHTVAEGWSGLETMSGIPGLTGATPVQNVGAYGAEIADVLTGLSVLDRSSGEVRTWTPEQCRFGFRTSAFKHTDRYVVLDVDRPAGPARAIDPDPLRRTGPSAGYRARRDRTARPGA